MTRNERNARRNQLLRQQDKYVRQWEPVIYTALRKQIAPVIKFLKQFGPVQTLAMLDTLIIPGAVGEVLPRLYRSVGVAAANDEYGHLIKLYGTETKAFGFNRFWASIMDAFYDLWGAQHVTNITETERKRIRNVLQKGVEDNLTIEQYVKVLQSRDVDKARARLIARTEAKMASGKGQDMGAKQTGILFNKTWLSARDKRTRRIPEDQTDHYHLNGVSIGEAEYFTVSNKKGANLMLYPGDTTMGAPASQLCNCRCVTTRDPVRDASGKIVRIR